jgi:hypothetical protein
MKAEGARFTNLSVTTNRQGAFIQIFDSSLGSYTLNNRWVECAMCLSYHPNENLHFCTEGPILNTLELRVH